MDVRALAAHAGGLRAAARDGARRRRGRGRLHRGDDPRGHARAAGDPDDRPHGQAPLAPRRVRDPRGHPGGGEHRRAAPPRGHLSASARVQARALPRAQARYIHVAAVRRRDPTLSRRDARDGRAARRARRDRAPDRPGGAGPGARAPAPAQRDDDPARRWARDRPREASPLVASAPRTPSGHRERLLAAMAVSIEQKGYRDTSVADVVGIARTSRRTYYEHFKDRDACFLALFDSTSEEM